MIKSREQMFRDMEDLLQSLGRDTEDLMTWGELIEALGVPLKADGNVDGPTLYNACLHVQDNSLYQSAPKEKRILMIRTAEAALSALRS